MTRFTDIMLDLETLGNAPGCIIFAIGAVPFNLDTGEVGAQEDSFYRIISVESARTYGLTSDTETLKWWSEQSAAARQEYDAAHKKGCFGMGQALEDFAAFFRGVGSETKVWGKGPSFDCSNLRAAYTAAHIQVPWKFWNERCVRTVYDEVIFPRPAGFKWACPTVAHNALHDAEAQATNVVAIHKLSRGGDLMWLAFDGKSGSYLGASWTKDADEVATPGSGSLFWRCYGPKGAE